MLRRLFLLASLLCAPVAAEELQPAALDQPRISAPAAVLESAGFGELFLSFGHSIAGSLRENGVTDERLLRAWESNALSAFGATSLNDELAARLAENLDDYELAGINAFMASPLGIRVANLEHVTQAVPRDQQIGVLAKGQMLYWRVSQTRRSQFEELLQLSGSEVSFALLAESLRALAVGLHLARADGDLVVPWEEIDRAVAVELAGMEERLAEATRATFAYTYETLTDEELEAYLSFLRAPAAQKFYGTATLVAGDIIRRTMLSLGESVAARLNAVQI